MYLRFKLFNRRIVFYSRRVVPVLGVNSTLQDGRHVPMLEFDEVNSRELLAELKNLQDVFRLGEILVLETGRPDSYHAIVLNSLDWCDAVRVVAYCKYTDLKHLQFSLKRMHFTLRLSNKKNRSITLYDRISSNYPNTAKIADLKSFVLYETAVRV